MDRSFVRQRVGEWDASAHALSQSAEQETVAVGANAGDGVDGEGRAKWRLLTGLGAAGGAPGGDRVDRGGV